jgi:MOSC domain-containing protein YiiM/ferredoxin-NADP reductase
MPALVSLNVGLPRDVPWQGRTVHTGIWKQPVTGDRMVRRLNIDGDGQGDIAGHGGPNRAVMVYQTESYDFWRDYLGRDDLTFGQFGENFTVDGLPDSEVCIGDRYRIGGAEFEVSQPRVTCFRVGMRVGEPNLPSLLVAHHRPGFYLRVLREGPVRAGDEIVRIGRGSLSVAEVDALLYLPNKDRAKLHQAAALPALSIGWRDSFTDLLAAPESGATSPSPGWSGFRPLRVVDVVTETPAVKSIHLAGDALPAALPGQYLTVRVPGAADPAPVRSYSLSGAPGAPAYRISVKRDGLVSRWLHTEVRPGQVLEVAAPRGDFVLADGTNPVVLVSAGIGVTPVLAMLHSLSGSGLSGSGLSGSGLSGEGPVDGGREVWWLHGARTAADSALAAEARGLLDAIPGSHRHVFYSATGRRMTPGALAALGIPLDATAYLCGPPTFLTDVESALRGLGLTDVRSELFGGRAAINPGVVGERTRPPHPPAGPPGDGPPVTFARSGLTVPFAGGGSSLLEFAESCDVPTRWSCRTGVCHLCETPLLAGSVEYSPEPLEAPAPGNALLCCSRPTSALVLDM